MARLIWLTNIDTAEPVGIPVEKVVLIEQKRPQDGGAVALYLESDKEIYVSESLERIGELLEQDTKIPRSPVNSIRAVNAD